MYIPPIISKDSETTLEVTLKDKNGDPISGADVMVKISGDADTTAINEIRCRGLNNGLYEASFTPRAYGDHEMYFLVNGDLFLDSPYK